MHQVLFYHKNLTKDSWVLSVSPFWRVPALWIKIIKTYILINDLMVLQVSPEGTRLMYRILSYYLSIFNKYWYNINLIKDPWVLPVPPFGGYQPYISNIFILIFLVSYYWVYGLELTVVVSLINIEWSYHSVHHHCQNMERSEWRGCPQISGRASHWASSILAFSSGVPTEASKKVSTAVSTENQCR